MDTPAELSPESALKLTAKNFIQTYGNNGGMYQNYTWENEVMKMGMHYEKGYYACWLYSISEPIRHIDLFILLKYLHNDFAFYDATLEKTGRWGTLSIDQYIDLIETHYDGIYAHFKDYNTEKDRAIQQFYETYIALKREAFLKNTSS